MKINIIILTLFFFFFSKLNAGQIFIVVKNIEEKVGSIHFALYDDPDFFPDNEGKKIGFKKDVKEVIEHGVLIEDLEESYYAIAIYHDKNSNNKFDTFLQSLKKDMVLVIMHQFFLAHLHLKKLLFL